MALNQVKLNDQKVLDFVALGLEDTEDKLSKLATSENQADECKKLFYEALAQVAELSEEAFLGLLSEEMKSKLNYVELVEGLIKICRAAADRTKVKGAGGGYSSFKNSEKVSFVRYINEVLKGDADLVNLGILPINPSNLDLFSATKNGILFCKLVNIAGPGTIDPRIVHQKEPLTKFQKLENLNNALSGAKAIGCTVVNINSQDLMDGRPALTLGILWQLMRIHLLSKIDVTSKLEILALKLPDEDTKTFMSVPQRDLLLRWVNYHLANYARWNDAHEGETKMITNFGSDIKDGKAYLKLLYQVAPDVIEKEKLKELLALSDADAEEDAAEAAATSDASGSVPGAADEGSSSSSRPKKVSAANLARAQYVVDIVKQIDPSIYMDPEEIVMGASRLNMAFLARVFSVRSGLQVENLDGIQTTDEDGALLTDPTKIVGLRREVLTAELEKIKKLLPQVRPGYLTALLTATEVFQEESLSFQEKLAHLEVEHEQLKKSAGNNSEDMRLMRERIDQLTRELETTKAANEALCLDLSVANSNLVQVNSKLTSTEEKLAEREDELKQLQKKSEAQIEELMHQLSRYQEEKTSLEEKTKTLATERKKSQFLYQQQVDTAQSEIDDLKSQIAKLKETIGKLEKTVAAQNDQITVLTEDKELHAKKMKETVARWSKMKLVLKEVRDDLSFVLYKAGKEAEEELARRKLQDLGAAKIPSPDKKGWLYKRPVSKQGKGGWKKRWFILKDNYLFYYDKEDSSSPNGFLRLDGCEANHIKEAALTDGKPNCFRAVDYGGKKDLIAAAEDETELKNWVFAIKTAAGQAEGW